eukprot:4996885-Prymnesium_polylepis.1
MPRATRRASRCETRCETRSSFGACGEGAHCVDVCSETLPLVSSAQATSAGPTISAAPPPWRAACWPASAPPLSPRSASEARVGVGWAASCRSSALTMPSPGAAYDKPSTNVRTPAARSPLTSAHPCRLAVASCSSQRTV